MEETQYGYRGDALTEVVLKLRDLEEKQKIIGERLLLIGQNLIEAKERVSQDILEMKKNIEITREQVERLTSFAESISGELSKFARKEDIEILTKQAKMFQPLEFVRRSELEKLKVK